MSSRVLKKLQGGDLDLQPNPEDDEQLSSPEDDPDLQTGKGKNNFFDLVSVVIVVVLLRQKLDMNKINTKVFSTS